MTHMRILKIIAFGSFSLTALLIGFWILSGRSSFHEAWGQKPSEFLSMENFEPPLADVFKFEINQGSPTWRAVSLTRAKLAKANLIADNQGAAHFMELRLFPYVYLFIPAAETYKIILNEEFYGARLNGVPVQGAKAAAEFLLHKKINELSIADMALLLAINYSPSKYDPNKNPGLTLEKRNGIIDGIVANRIISVETGETEKAKPISVF